MWATFRLIAEMRSPITIFRSDGTMTVQVLAMTSDLFLQSRITELAKSLGGNAKIVTTEEDLLRQANLSAPNLVVLDLASSEHDPFSCSHTDQLSTWPGKAGSCLHWAQKREHSSRQEPEEVRNSRRGRCQASDSTVKPSIF